MRPPPGRKSWWEDQSEGLGTQCKHMTEAAPQGGGAYGAAGLHRHRYRLVPKGTAAPPEGSNFNRLNFFQLDRLTSRTDECADSRGARNAYADRE